VSLMFFTEYRDPPSLHTFDLPADNHAIFSVTYSAGQVSMHLFNRPL